MIEKKIIKKTSLDELFKKIKSSDRRIFAPVEKDGKILFSNVDSYNAVASDYIQTTLSAKEILLPRCEEVLRFTTEQKSANINEVVTRVQPTVIFGVRPCDAKSLEILNAVYMKDYPDTLYNKRLTATTIIGLSCKTSDAHCFCTSVGGSPGDTAGSDILMTQTDGDNYLVEILTEKGKAIVALAPQLFTVSSHDDKEKQLASVKQQFDASELAKKLEGLFDSVRWQKQSLRCIGCGTCSYACPACTCFDIQDETDGNHGVRLRCWDSCGFGLFTLHTSGHNPRDVQSKRWRQRIMHKFSYQPNQLNVVGCVGCGRCSRACPVDMSILEHIKDILEAT